MLAYATILSSLQETVRKFPDRPAVSDDGRTVTYRGLWQEAERYAEQLVSRGFTGGNANLIEAQASVSFAVSAIGTYLARGVFVPVVKNAPVDLWRHLEAELRVHCRPDVADVLHTTGTTGVSKAVMLSPHAVWASADNNRHFDRITEETVYLIASPLNHVSALRKLEACFLVGAHAVLLDGFVDMKHYYETISKHHVNALLLPPAAVILLLSVGRERLHALADQIQLVHSNGAPMLEVTKESLRRCLPHTRLVFAYGATEAGSACCAYDYATLPGKANCVGRPSPHVKVGVEGGRIVISGDTVMNGYLGRSVRADDVLRNGKLYTNDLGYIDADGLVFVVGRRDDVINCGGLKVAPSEVEGVAMSYPGVSDCVCFGVDDCFMGKAVKLLVVPTKTSGFDLSDYRRFLQKRLERHQVPAQIVCVTAIPRKPNGKVDRTRLR